MFYSIQLFIIIWTTYFLLLIVLPVSSLAGFPWEAVFWQIIFVFITVCVAITTSQIFRYRRRRSVVYPMPSWLSPSRSRRIVIIGIIFSLLGLISFVYDKVFIQRLDYTSGLVVAREQWRLQGENRVGISSIFSVAGYLFSTSFIVALFPMIIRPEILSKKVLYFSSISFILMLMINSILIGGRSIILVTIVFVLAFYAIRRERGGGRLSMSKAAWLSAIFSSILIVFYVLYVFADRARHTHGGVSSYFYLTSMLEYLGAEPEGWLSDFEKTFPVLGQMINYIVLAGTYLTHSVFTFSSIIDHHFEDSTIMFGFFRSLLSKLGLTDLPDLHWFLAGRFPSLPGILLHDGGKILLLFGAGVLGVTTGLANIFIRRRNPSLLVSGLSAGIYATLFLSPLFLSADIMSFPFIMLEFFLFSLIFDLMGLLKVKSHPGSLCD